MAEVKIPPLPKGIGAAGRRLWVDVQQHYALEQHEELLLRQMCRVVDQLDALQVVIDRDGMMVPGPALTQRVNPAVIEARQLAIALSRLSAALRLPAGEEGDQPKHLRRPQRRSGVRGPYGIKGLVS